MTTQQISELDKILASIKSLAESQAQTDEQMKKTDEIIKKK